MEQIPIDTLFYKLKYCTCVCPEYFEIKAKSTYNINTNILKYPRKSARYCFLMDICYNKKCRCISQIYSVEEMQLSNKIRCKTRAPSRSFDANTLIPHLFGNAISKQKCSMMITFDTNYKPGRY